jgi:hypothetical protein
VGINIIPRNVLVQLIDMFIILVDGSNTEKKIRYYSVIIVIVIVIIVKQV